jgi:tRNA(Met) C34 N-acetyltransferase TmcA
MFYKIQYEEANVSAIFESLRECCKIIFTSSLLFANTELTKPEIIAKMKETLANDIQFLVLPINDNNLKQQPDTIQKKVIEERIALEKKRFEEEQQEALQEANKFLDELQNNLDKQLQSSTKGGKKSAKLQPEKDDKSTSQ